MNFSYAINDLHKAYLAKGENYQIRSKHINADGSPKFINKLIFEKSPYLLQHAHNPLNWHAWNTDTFKIAKKANKLIFLSIGYSTCHWCHVMEEESFDDIDVAKILNKNFIAIKVDREVRPDIDELFMSAAQLLIGSGGWPLNVILTPDGKVFFAGTYLSKENLLNTLSQLQDLWINNPKKITTYADKVEKILQQTKFIDKRSFELNAEFFDKSVTAILENFDSFNGGFSITPKFPNETMLLLLLEAQRKKPDATKLNAITTTLDAMARGGIYDVVGGGFHRYAIDNMWLIPHFEKMLYNQAQLAEVYMTAYELTKIVNYKKVALKTLDYVINEMMDKNYGFYSATDADSEGVEGLFFIWDIEELKNILNKEEFQFTTAIFNISKNGNFEGKNIIYYHKTIEQYAKENNLNKDNLASIIDTILLKLYQARQKREKPLLDNKIILSWNAMMISSFIKAARILNDKKYINIAFKSIKFIENNFINNNSLKRIMLNTKVEIDAMLEDYAYLIQAYLDLYDYTHDRSWLFKAEKLNKAQIAKFWDYENFAFFSNIKTPNLRMKLKQGNDGAIASANAISFNNLVRLYRAIGVKNYKTKAEKLILTFSEDINQFPNNYAVMMLKIKDLFNDNSKIKYIYNANVRIELKKIENVYREESSKKTYYLNLELKKGWYINSFNPKQKNLIATKITNLDDKNWDIVKVNYPKESLKEVKFSKNKIAIYSGKINIELILLQKNKNSIKPKFSLNLQACNKNQCLSPEIVEFSNF